MKHTFVDYKIEAELQDTVLRWIFLFKLSQETKSQNVKVFERTLGGSIVKLFGRSLHRSIMLDLIQSRPMTKLPKN